MSLINKMLQDLEERRSEGNVVGSLQGQLRAAPQPKRMHTGWWLALVLAIMLTAVVSWLWGRQSAPVVVVTQPITPPSLPLKMDSELTVISSRVIPESSVEVKPTDLPNTTEPANKIDGMASASVNVDDRALPASPVTRAQSPETPVQSMPPRSAVASSEVKALPASPVPITLAKAAAMPLPKTRSMPEAVSEDMPLLPTKQLKELTPQQRAENEYRRATGLIQQGRAAEATAALEQALQIDPQHWIALQTLVGMLLENKRHDEAIRRLQEGLALDRTQSALAMMLARVQVDKNYLKPAIDTLQRSLPYALERADYLAFLAALFQRDGRHKEAIEQYLIALRKSPQNGIWWMGLGISLQSEGRLREARDAYLQASSTNTLSPELLAFVEQKLAQLR